MAKAIGFLKGALMFKGNSTEKTLWLEDRKVYYTIKKSHRAKHLKLQLSLESGLEVIVPFNTRLSFKQIENFIFEKQRWILRNVQKLEQLLKQARSFKDSIPFLGEEIPVKVKESNRKTARAFLCSEFLEVRIPSGKKKLIGKAIKEFYKKQAREIIYKIAGRKARQMNVSFSKISIRSQKTRWGSCSVRSTLSFNWRLLAAPRSVLEYIVVHELAHLKHRNHSKKFWLFVKKFCPDYKEQEKWLHKNKHLLKARTSFD